MKWRFIFIVFLSSTFFCGISNAAPLTKARLEQFSQHLLAIKKESPKKIIPYLSDKLAVETSVGSSIQGFTLYYNKAEYSKLINKLTDAADKTDKKIDFDVFDHIVKSNIQGQFTVTSYARVKHIKVWSTYVVALENDKIKIISIVESIL